jgi:hypothetical protein
MRDMTEVYRTATAPRTMASIPPETRLEIPALTLGTTVVEADALAEVVLVALVVEVELPVEVPVALAEALVDSPEVVAEVLEAVPDVTVDIVVLV